LISGFFIGFLTSFSREFVLFLIYNFKMTLEELKDKKILILGFGREGMDTFLFLKNLFPDKKLGIADKNKRAFLPSIRAKTGIVWHLGYNYLNAMDDYDVIIKSPGIPFKNIPKSSINKVITQTDIFFANCPGKIVGITGTKGKSTTTSLAYEILKEGGLKAFLVGNIGKPVLSLLSSASEKDIYVYELSSHQLFNLKKSPYVAVFLNIYPEHLDYYKNLQEYARAKANVTMNQTKEDFLIYNGDDPLVKKFAEKSIAKKILIDTKKLRRIIRIKDVPLLGKFNLKNVMAAAEVGKIFKIPKTRIRKAILNFKPLEHRLENIGTYKGITFYNDALSTIPETAMAAIDALGKNVQTIILGGFDRGIDFKKLAEKICKSKIKNLIFFPTTGKKMWEEIKKIKKPESFMVFFTDNMKTAVKKTYESTESGKICLMSCASTSFSIFKNYEEKGNLFKKFVKFFGK
jgi:UDP-N-acetylmuramoyl-L-alanine---L-glutamate ligase